MLMDSVWVRRSMDIGWLQVWGVTTMNTNGTCIWWCLILIQSGKNKIH